MRTALRKILGAAAIAAPLALPGAAYAVPVDLELALLVDVSGSVDDNEYALQKTGYVNAFQSAALQAAIELGALGKIAVTYIEWSGAGAQNQAVGWTEIDTGADANAFAAAVNAVARTSFGNTAPGSALNFAVPLFTGNGFEGTREVVDVSGDGVENEGADTATARAAALAAGIDAINGLPIGGDASVVAFYQNEIVGGTGGFLVVANDFGDFGDAVLNKLEREIRNPVPEPMSIALLATGLFGLSMVARRRRAKLG